MVVVVVAVVVVLGLVVMVVVVVVMVMMVVVVVVVVVVWAHPHLRPVPSDPRSPCNHAQTCRCCTRIPDPRHRNCYRKGTHSCRHITGQIPLLRCQIPLLFRLLVVVGGSRWGAVRGSVAVVLEATAASVETAVVKWAVTPRVAD